MALSGHADRTRDVRGEIDDGTIRHGRSTGGNERKWNTLLGIGWGLEKALELGEENRETERSR